jgi:OOP family OmpA-OmpF porin
MRQLRFGTMAWVLLALAAPLAGCHAKAHVALEAKAPPPPPPAPVEPAPEPPPAPIVNNKIVLPGELEFEVSTAKIQETEGSLAILNELVRIMKDNPQITKLRIEGHTDSSGRAKKNLRLSRDRASAVATWLAAHDIDKDRLVTVGLGDTKPLVDNDTAENRAQNRRTEFHIQDVDGKPVADEANVVAAR